tara:strand:+ start:173 stop:1648 length:1476 start_codon:yes stop_codon:yes gene_type:complete
MGSKHPDHIDFAGDYNLNGIILQAHDGTGGRIGEGGVNIQALVQELNIYEGINQTTVYGTLVIVDSLNLISNLPIQGTERLFFKLSTPGSSNVEHIIDASEETGHPFYVYKISNKQQTSQGTQVYTIHFCSREFLRNIRTKVSKAYEGKLSDMVQQIVAEKEGLDSRKTLYYEETSNSDKFVMPNISPFKAIGMIAKRALPEHGNGVGYYYYETTKGLYFQSWENMCAKEATHKRDAVQEFYYMPQNITDEKIDEPKEIHDLKSVEEYKFVNTFHDTAAAQALGTYGHRVISHNLFAKDFKETDWNYHNEFNQTVHADQEESDKSTTNPTVSGNPVDFDNNNVSDYAESMVSLQPTTQFLHNEASGSFGTDVNDDGRLEGIRNAQKMQVEAGTTIQMTIKGQTYIQPGNVIDFKVRPVEPEGQTADKKTYDPQYSGRYVVCKVRHRVTKQDYKMVLEVKKDSVKEAHYGSSVDNFVGTANNENAQYKKIDS